MGKTRQAASTTLRTVQFFHPGRECPVKMPPGKTSTVVPWTVVPREKGCGTGCGPSNTRRLISHWGTYIEGNGQPQEAQLSFWGEWEADTVAKTMPAPRGDRRYAHWVHELLPLRRTGRPGLLDTDPCVFGRTFKYCYCQQCRNNVLPHLASGSLVLFGSRIEGSFYLDTVFVVDGEGVPYVAPEASNLSVSKEYRELTLTKVAYGKHVFYRGKTFQSGEPYSFVPALLFQEGNPECGRRFQLDLDKVNRLLPPGDGLTLNWHLYRKSIPANEKTILSIWKEIRRQVRAAGFLPAVRFNWPK